MYSRAKKDWAFIRKNDNPSIGPGVYAPQERYPLAAGKKTNINNHLKTVPFLSQSERKTAFDEIPCLPAPNQYVNPSDLCTDQVPHIHQSQQPRFPDPPSITPAPNAYDISISLNHHENHNNIGSDNNIIGKNCHRLYEPILNKGIVVEANTDGQEYIKRVPVETIPSIPYPPIVDLNNIKQGKKDNQKEDPKGFSFPKSEKGLKLPISDSPGPLKYDVIHAMKHLYGQRSGGIKMLGAGERLMDAMTHEALKKGVPGPGTYVASKSEKQEKAIRFPTAPRDIPIKSGTPGPCAYNTGKTTLSVTKVFKFDSFGSQAPRFNEGKNVDADGPDFYDLDKVNSLYATVQKAGRPVVNVKYGFGSTANRFIKERAEGPSPGQYAVAVPIVKPSTTQTRPKTLNHHEKYYRFYNTLEGIPSVSQDSGFGSSDDRFRGNSPETPGPYDYYKEISFDAYFNRGKIVKNLSNSEPHGEFPLASKFTPGPATYNTRQSPVKKALHQGDLHFISRSERFRERTERVPSPGSYDVVSKLIKPTFNVTLVENGGAPVILEINKSAK